MEGWNGGRKIRGNHRKVMLEIVEMLLLAIRPLRILLAIRNRLLPNSTMGLSHFYFPRKSNGCNWIWYYCPLIQLACSIAFKNQQFDRVRFAIQNFAFCRWNGSSVLFNQLWHSSNHHKISIWSDASIQFFQYFPNERTLHAIDVLLASLCVFVYSLNWLSSNRTFHGITH